MESLGVTMGPVFGSFALAFVACFATYAVTPRKWSADLRSRVFSTVNAILTFIVACQSAYRRKGQVWEGDLDLLTDNSDMSEKMVVAWVFGYFCADWFIGVYTNILDKATVLHHLIGIFSTSYCLYTDVGYAMCTLWLLNEASSPFVNMHHALVEFGIHDWRKAV